MRTRSSRCRTAVLVLAIAVAITATLAMGVAQALPGAQQQIGEQVQQGAGKAAEANPEKAKKRIAAAIKKLESLKEKKLEAFNKQVEKAKKASEKFASLGLDVTKLNADIAAVESKVSGAAKEVDQVIAALKKAESLATSENPEEFKAAAKDAMSKVRALRTQIKEIREFSKGTIKPEIKALARQARQKSQQSK